MTELAEAAGVLAPPRRRDAAATRASILEAAKTAFAVTGYDRTSLRDIAALAGSDVALIPRYFGGKEGLFTEALKATIAPDRLRDWDRRRFARDVAEMMAGAADIADPRTQTFQFLLQAATSPTTAPLLGGRCRSGSWRPSGTGWVTRPARSGPASWPPSTSASWSSA